nr:chaperone NapD [uncultured Desulfobulbus sp.]
MPICGVVITAQPEHLDAACAFLRTMAEVEVHGTDGKGNIVAVFDTKNSEAMEHVIKTVNACPFILHAGITYINMEDLLEASCGEEG